MTSASASRVTRSRRNLQLALLLFAGVLAAATVLRAQETAPKPPAAEGATPAQSAPPAAASESETAEAATAAAATPPAPAGKSPARFEPTEKVRADFDVSFPIDI